MNMRVYLATQERLPYGVILKTQSAPLSSIFLANARHFEVDVSVEIRSESGACHHFRPQLKVCTLTCTWLLRVRCSLNACCRLSLVLFPCGMKSTTSRTQFERGAIHSPRSVRHPLAFRVLSMATLDNSLSCSLRTPACSKSNVQKYYVCFWQVRYARIPVPADDHERGS